MSEEKQTTPSTNIPLFSLQKWTQNKLNKNRSEKPGPNYGFISTLWWPNFGVFRQSTAKLESFQTTETKAQSPDFR